MKIQELKEVLKQYPEWESLTWVKPDGKTVALCQRTLCFQHGQTDIKPKKRSSILHAINPKYSTTVPTPTRSSVSTAMAIVWWHSFRTTFRLNWKPSRKKICTSSFIRMRNIGAACKPYNRIRSTRSRYVRRNKMKGIATCMKEKS